VILLIDGDPLVYRAAFSKEGDTISGLCDKLDKLVQEIFDKTKFFVDGKSYMIYLTGRSNFRKEITKTYKAQRKQEKPPLFQLVRQYLRDNYDTIESVGEEADDLIAIEATKHSPEDVVIVSLDKDFLQVPSRNYNPMRDEWTVVEEWPATLFFWTQMLTGDTADNIKGVYKVGPVGAAKLYAECKTEAELFEVCKRAYDGNMDRLKETGQLLWLRRYEGEMWEPPNETIVS
jgi:5'-3' exonuclease|tara:strand:+ start:275 stop:970 length:696 start_codon:yes stop_codon:yes gene_type:complete